jgi:hypothetical protein
MEDSILPGATSITLILNGLHSRLRTSLKILTAAFEESYIPVQGVGLRNYLNGQTRGWHQDLG